MRLLSNYPDCLVCGQKNSASLKTKFYIEGDKVIAFCTPQACHAGYKGITHGGLLGSILDEALGRIVSNTTKKFVVTGTLEIKYKKSVPIETPLRIEAWMNAEQKRPRFYCEATGEIWNEEKTILYTTATGKFFKVPENKYSEILSSIELEGCHRSVTIEDL